MRNYAPPPPAAATCPSAVDRSASTEEGKPLAIEGAMLVIGYGNELRGDDGLGPHIAERIERRHLPNVRTRIVHQLTPELAEELSTAALAVFVDARREPDCPEWEVLAIGPRPTTMSMTHACDPSTLLAFAQAIYGRAPQAWLVQVRGARFEPGEELSAPAQRPAAAAVEAIVKKLSSNA